MLTLRQVLMADNPKVTPAELESSISELFEALLKILDGSPDAGTDEIVETMIRASASVGSPPSEEKVQSRRQMVARVFLKSLQPGEVVGLQEGLLGHPLRLPRRRPGGQRRQGPEAGRGGAAPRRRGEARRQGGEGRRGGDQGGHGVGEGLWSVVRSSDVNVETVWQERYGVVRLLVSRKFRM